jgi:hypothetical protein
MFRSSLIAASALLLCATASAQGTRLSGSVRTLQKPVRDAGTFHMDTKTWTRGTGPIGSATSTTTVFNNTCMWTGLAANTITYIGLEPCEAIWDEGRVPGAGVGGSTSFTNLIHTVQVGYLTFAALGAVDLEYLVFNPRLTTCTSASVSPNPPLPPFAGRLLLNPSNGVTLPGDPSGTGSAWIVTIDLKTLTGDVGGNLTNDVFCMLSDADGTTGNGNDTFSWRAQHSNASIGANQNGFIIAGEPLTGAAGSCAFTVACGSDPNIGDCGTARSASDLWWHNTDGDNPTIAGVQGTCVNGTDGGCYYFGGWPGNPFSSFFLKMESSGPCATFTPTFYCTGKTNSQGCVPFLSTTGTASVSDTNPFNIIENNGIPAEAGILIYSTAKANLNFHGGKLCVKAPFTRTGAKTPKAATNCKGGAGSTLTRNFNTTIQGGGDPTLTAGALRHAQWRQRDPSDTTGFGDNLTDGVGFTIQP